MTMNEYKCPVCGNLLYSSSPLLKVKCQSCGCEYLVDEKPQVETPQPEQSVKSEEPKSAPQPEKKRDIFDEGPSGKSRGVAGLLAIFLGFLGVHYFYLGKTTPGIIILLVSIFSCGVLAAVVETLTLIQGIIMLTMSEEDFEKKYTDPNVSFPM